MKQLLPFLRNNCYIFLFLYIIYVYLIDKIKPAKGMPCYGELLSCKERRHIILGMNILQYFETSEAVKSFVDSAVESRKFILVITWREDDEWWKTEVTTAMQRRGWCSSTRKWSKKFDYENVEPKIFLFRAYWTATSRRCLFRIRWVLHVESRYIRYHYSWCN